MEEVFGLVEQLHDDVDQHKLDTPQELKNVVLRPYQIIGFSWIVSRWKKNINCLLADDMGLGKTVQTITTLLQMKFHEGLKSPFLIICPLSLVENWSNEFASFAPQLVVKRYVGSTEEREAVKTDIISHILKQPRSQWADPDVNFDVLITTYDFAIKDKDLLSKFSWRALIVDEAHRLKNASSKLFGALHNMKRQHVLLLTGTPIQNSLQELFSLLHFIMPGLFEDADTFINHFKPLSTPGGGHGQLEEELHRLLKPFLLRREREQVLHDLPPKKEFIIYTPLSPQQREFYVSILKKDVTGVLKDDKRSLVNVLMNLRKACNHPYLFDGAEPEFDGEFQLGEHLVTASGKLVILDKLLSKFKRSGEKVLIFSQMTRMLDIVQDYMHLRGHTYERLDGSVRGNERWLAVEQFSRAESDTFAFLLSTRAGGVGLNLTAASAVIFIDSDFNPQNDLQAQARCLRIGQKKPVSVIRLCCPHTVEEIILARGHGKLRLKSRVLARGQFSSSAAQDGTDKEENLADDLVSLGEIVRFGVKQVLSDDNSAYAAISDEDIESILQRGKLIVNDAPAPGASSSAAAAATATATATAVASQNVEQLPSGPEFEHTMLENEAQSLWFFDGHDYSNDRVKEDEDALEKLIVVDEDENEDKNAPHHLRTPSKRGVGTPKKRGAATGIVDDEADEVQEDLEDERTARRLARKRTFAESFSSPRSSAKKRAKISDEEEGADEEEGMAGTRKVGTRSRPAPPPGYVSMSISLSEEEIQQLIEDASKMAIAQRAEAAPAPQVEASPAIIDDEDEGRSDTGLSGDVPDDSNTSINLVTGDVSKPMGPSTRPKLIISTFDDSGSWGRGRLFDALSRLCAAAPVQYSLAAQARELDLGSLHVISCHDDMDDNIDDGGRSNLFLGLLICQHRKKSDGSVGSINMKRLQEGLWKAAKWALAHGATVHLPRIGATVPGTNWYSIERLIRGTLGKVHVETYIYYFARNPGSSSSSKPALQRRGSSGLSRSQSLLREEPALPAPAPVPQRRDAAAEEAPAAAAAVQRSSTMPQGLKVGLYRVGASMQQKARNAIASIGGEICSILQDANVVLTSQQPDADEILVDLSAKGVQIVDVKQWVAENS